MGDDGIECAGSDQCERLLGLVRLQHFCAREFSLQRLYEQKTTLGIVINDEKGPLAHARTDSHPGQWFADS